MSKSDPFLHLNMHHVVAKNAQGGASIVTESAPFLHLNTHHVQVQPRSAFLRDLVGICGKNAQGGNQRKSEEMKGNDRKSEEIRGTQRKALEIKRNQSFGISGLCGLYRIS